ncbi:transposase InsO family protein [Bradyrhizobium sp. ERR14]|nr:transposase InsO family protein [Bradyrhizobium sp. ERR14]
MPKDSGDRQLEAVPANLLDRQFIAERPNQKWIADFTYLWTAEGWHYVAAVIDLFSRRAVGWSMSAAMTAQLVTDALLMAVWRRGKPDALLHHSDWAVGPARGYNTAGKSLLHISAQGCVGRKLSRLGPAG